jgi:hypothetical protein
MRDSADPLVLSRTTRFLAVLALLSGIAVLTGIYPPGSRQVFARRPAIPFRRWTRWQVCNAPGAPQVARRRDVLRSGPMQTQ